MRVISELAACPRPEAGSVVTIGAYDGVHLGHQALLARTRAMAAELGSALSVVTFDRHPASVVRPESAPKLLTDLEHKLELLAAAGVDHTLVLRFDEERARESAEDFVTEVLVGCLAARAVVVGHDFHFGHRRRGNVVLLQEMGARLGFDVLGLRLVGEAGTGDAGVAVSSTLIRGLVAAGRVEDAARLLGRPHEVRGTVVRGDGRGRELGFPTANVEVPADILMAADGVYAGWYVRPGPGALGTAPAAISVGTRPTFHEGASQRVLEAHVVDFDGDLYGERAHVRFGRWLHGQERFASASALVDQMARDVEATRAHAAGRS